MAKEYGLLYQAMCYPITVKSGVSIVKGDLIAPDSNGEAVLANAAVGTVIPAAGISLESNADGRARVTLAKICIVKDTSLSLTPNARMYLDEGANAGKAKATAPSDSGDLVQIVGKALSSNIVRYDVSDNYTIVGA